MIRLFVSKKLPFIALSLFIWKDCKSVAAFTHTPAILQPASFAASKTSFYEMSPTPLSTLQMTSSPDSNEKKDKGKNFLSVFNTKFSRRALFISTSLAWTQFYFAQAYAPADFKRVPTQFIAALGDPDAKSGSNAKDWGLWTVDPGPRGVFLDQYKKQLVDRNGVAPAGWKFDEKDWWLEEHGLIMEAPTFPVPAGKYLVTGGRRVTTTLTIEAPDKVTGEQRWKLDEGKLFDVTHLPCRSARYHPKVDGEKGSPSTANKSDFPVTPGAEMPNVKGCDKLDYAVIFLIGKAVSEVA